MFNESQHAQRLNRCAPKSKGGCKLYCPLHYVNIHGGECSSHNGLTSFILWLLFLLPQQADIQFYWQGKRKGYLNYLLLKGTKLSAFSLNYLALSYLAMYVQY